MTSVKPAKKHKKHRWSSEEDHLLIEYVKDYLLLYRDVSWRDISKRLDRPGRSGKACRERYLNYLDPNLSQEPFTIEEDTLLFKLYDETPGRWTLMVKQHFPHRSSSSLKNRYYSQRYRDIRDEIIIKNNQINHKEEELLAGKIMFDLLKHTPPISVDNSSTSTNSNSSSSCDGTIILNCRPLESLEEDVISKSLLN